MLREYNIALHVPRVAIAYARVRIISRGKNGSSLRSAAYNWRQRVTGDKPSEDYDFSHKDAVLHHEVRLPGGASSAFEKPEHLWRTAEKAETRKNSQLAKEVVIALPVGEELRKKDWVAMTQQFADQQFVSRGVAVQIDIHPDTTNPHAHILITTRRIEGDRMARYKARDLNPPFARSKGAKKGFVTEADQIGQAWSDLQNRYFREHGIPLRVDPTAAEPGYHIGPVRHRKPEDKKAARDAELRVMNRAAAMDPEKVIQALTRTKATFTEREVGRFLYKAGLDKVQSAEVKAKVMGHHSLVALYDPKTGQEAERYTTKAIRAQERRVMSEAAMVAATHHPALGIPAPKWLRADQRLAHEHITGLGGLKVVEGRAGVGKSALLSAAKDAFEAKGYRVIGMGPTNVVASDMRERDGIREARTAHSWLFRLKNQMDSWSHKTVVFIDEGAMQSAEIAGEVMKHAREAQAKVILVGDDRQFGSIERGGMFTELAAAHGSVEISEIVRQKDEWQRQVSRDLAAGRFHAAVEALDGAGAISWSEDHDASLARLVGAWAQDVKADPGKTRFAFAWTNSDVDILNREMREVRKGRGELGPEFSFATKHGVSPFSRGDRVQFTDTRKLDGIYNGEAGVITGIHAHRVEARTDSGKTVNWDPREFQGFRLGYSGTIYKGQGQTLDSTYVLHSSHWHASASYVALTRQRSEVKLFVSRTAAVNLRELAEQMGRPEQRSASLRWEDNREEAVRKAVEIGHKLQEQEAARRQAAILGPPKTDLDYHARQIVARWTDYDDVFRLEMAKEIAKGRALDGRAHDRVANRLKAALDRAETHEGEVRKGWSAEQWARAIHQGRATEIEALQGLGQKIGKNDPEMGWKALTALNEARQQATQSGRKQSARRRA